MKFPRKFEVIYVGSLFSHLPAPRFKTWLQRLYEALDDDGLLIFTTAGRWGSQREGDAKGTGFTFVCESESGSLPKHEYGGTWVTEKWVRDLAAELSLARVHYLEFELWAQDVFVVTKSCTPALEALQANAYPLGAIEIVALDPSGRLRVSGWAMDRRWGAPVQSVRIEIDGALSAMAETGLTRPDVASYFERPDSECAGWYYAGHAGPIKGTFDSAVVRVLIEGRDGAVTCLVSLIEREGFEASAAGFEGPFITNDELVKHVYRVCLFREADPAELHHWTRVLDDGLDFGEVVKHFLDCDERRHIEAGGGKLYVPPGHYYSPIVATRQVTCLFDGDTPRPRGDLEISIDLNEEEQQRNWRDMVPLFGDLPFPEQPNGQTRYYYENPSYNRGDAMVLAAMLRMRRPQRVIEVGSGFSSACMLDINERYLNCQAAITFIEPYPEVLHTLLRPGDTQRTNLVCRPVQDVEVRLLEELESGDILFIDSTHVVKTGSDVIFEFFELLPRLKKGVVVHFHDMFFPFEYPRHFVIDENRSWNELYLMRAFLMYNKTFEIIFFNDFFAKRYRADIEAAAPSFLLNPGGGLWLRKCSEEERWPPSRSRMSWARLLKRVFDIDFDHCPTAAAA